MSEKKHFNNKVAAKRGKKWRDSLAKGRLEARANPSRLAEIRMGKGIRQIDIASRLQIAMSTYCAIERGKRLVKDLIAKHIAAELGVRVVDVFTQPKGDKIGCVKWTALFGKKGARK